MLVRLTTSAADDFTHIYDYTEEHFGPVPAARHWRFTTSLVPCLTEGDPAASPAPRTRYLQLTLCGGLPYPGGNDRNQSHPAWRPEVAMITRPAKSATCVYPVLFTPEGKGFVVTVPGIAEVVTEGDSVAEATEYAIDAIELVLGEYMRRRDPIPRPSKRRGRHIRIVELPLLRQAKLSLYSAMQASGLRKADLARRLKAASRAPIRSHPRLPAGANRASLPRPPQSVWSYRSKTQPKLGRYIRSNSSCNPPRIASTVDAGSLPMRSVSSALSTVRICETFTTLALGK
jgi:predicted RNase H-like HicB family nuclease